MTYTDTINGMIDNINSHHKSNLGVRMHRIQNLRLLMGIHQFSNRPENLPDRSPEGFPPVGRQKNQLPPPRNGLSEIGIDRFMGSLGSLQEGIHHGVSRHMDSCLGDPLPEQMVPCPESGSEVVEGEDSG